MRMRHGWLTVAGALVVVGCGSNEGKKGAGSASASVSAAPSASAVPDKNLCKGPSGTVSGTVRIVGDEPPNTPFSYKKGCEGAAGTYGKLFRQGQEGQLADAMVTVTWKDRCRVPIESKVIELTIKDCAYNARTVVMTDGQHIEIKNKDSLASFLPILDGAKSASTNVAVPRGPAVKLRSNTGGKPFMRYWIRDQMGSAFQVVHVFHLAYATTDVTGLDGTVEIKGVPVGAAKLSVMLPQTRTMLTKNVDIEVKADGTTQDVELVFDKEKDTPVDGHGGTKPSKLPLPSASSSASPAPSASPSPSASAP